MSVATSPPSAPPAGPAAAPRGRRPRGPAGEPAWLDAGLAAAATVVSSWSAVDLVVGRGWIGPMLVCVGTVLLVGALLRPARLPVLGHLSRGGVVAAQALAVAVVLSWIFADAPGHHWYGLPRPEVLGVFADLLGEGVRTIQESTVPAPGAPGMVFVVAASFGAVGLAVDAAGVTWRSPALAGLPLLVVLTVTASGTGEPLSPRYFLATAAAWLALVARQGLASVRAWSTEHAWSRTAVAHGGGEAMSERETRRHGTWATSLALVTAVVAVLGAGLLPHLSPVLSLPGVGHGAGIGGAGGQISFTQTLDLAKDLGSRSTRPVLTYVTNQGRPGPLRVTVSTRYLEGRWWSTVADPQGSPPAEPPLVPPGVEDVTKAPWSLTVLTNEVRAPQVAVPSTLETLDAGVGTHADERTGVLFVTDHPDTYTATGWQPAGIMPDGVGAGPAPGPVDPDLLQVPDRARRAVTTLADEVTAGADNQIMAARTIQSYLRGPDFRYSLTLADPVLDGAGRALDPVSHFLATRVGYCTQFATAMVMMARAEGIPARLAVGFLPGTEGDDGVRTVVAADAHAWPELYITGLGWTRFEPTPPARTGGAPVYLTESDLTGAPGSDATPTPTAAPTEDATADPAAAPSAGGGDGGLPWREAGTVALVALVLAVAVGALPGAAWWRRRRRARAARTGPETVEAAWAALLDGLADLGVAVPVSATPRRLAAHVSEAAHLDPAAARAVRAVADRVEGARYRPDEAGAGPVARETRTVLRAVAARAGRRARLRALLWPVSGRRQVADWAAAARAPLTRAGRHLEALAARGLRRA